MSIFWNVWIIGLTSTCLLLVLWVLLANRKVAKSDDEAPENKTTGHVYDGIEEYDNPLPKWWFIMFIASFVFGIIYLILYPGMGSYPGAFGSTNLKELEEDQKALREQQRQTLTSRYGESLFVVVADVKEAINNLNAQKQKDPSRADEIDKKIASLQASIDAKYQSIADLSKDEQAMRTAFRIFENNCSICHGSDGGGQVGYPNLRDADWLYGGSPEKIHETLIYGRNGMMPNLGLKEEDVNSLSQYVLKLSFNARSNKQKEKPEYQYDKALAQKGQELFAQNCASCHGGDGRGDQEVGAPNLTDNIWLYGGSGEMIRTTLRHGRNGVMPAQGKRLDEYKIHLLAAYVYSLSREGK